MRIITTTILGVLFMTGICYPGTTGKIAGNVLDAETGDPLPCFTTRVDTIFGVTYMVMAAEHPKLRQLVAGTEREGEVLGFADRAPCDGGPQAVIEPTHPDKSSVSK